ncbi:Uncharacterized protein QJS10_CPB19g00553 [Acorus calamus]|uniref:Erythronate-4-phosphate dehydrogenase family protein n=1 Tax=Acorus calamus TaxID=4465 RepID=A0AAV9CLA0_ACOCL|nr:Uncharacterized protein QJS10_CPB19g00553 [Acorus calamus]
MDYCYDPKSDDKSVDTDRNIIIHSIYQPKLSPWLDLRVFYVRVTNCEVDGSTPEYLTLNHIPLSPDTLMEVNGTRSNLYSECVSSVLRRDRVDKKSEEATFVSTDSIRVMGSVRLEVYDGDELLLSGVLEMSNGNGFIGESKKRRKKWRLNCESMISPSTSFLRGKKFGGPDVAPPMIEVYVAGCFAGNPIILTKTIVVSCRKQQNWKGMLDSIPEHEMTGYMKDVPPESSLQISEFQKYKPENEESDVEYANRLYSRAECMEGEDGELSWFNAGVRVGVGISLGICLGVGIGVGVLVRTYQATTRNFKRRLI